MSEQVRAAREDLAFLRSVAEDRGPLPRIVGQHFLVVGLLYGANVIYIWAGQRGFAPWPENAHAYLGWAPAALLHIPYALWFSWRTRGHVAGPTLRAFGVAWMAMVLMTASIVASIFMARAKTDLQFELIWPAIAVSLYGGAWTVVSVTRRSLADFLVAIGCFATAVVCAALVGTPEIFLALGLGIVLFFGGPGLAILLKGRR